ncbi:MAG: hypothetical protein AAGL10_07720 [Pseudomonadota bacterium]
MIASFSSSASPAGGVQSGRSIKASLTPGAPRPASARIASLEEGHLGDGLERTTSEASGFAMAAKDLFESVLGDGVAGFLKIKAPAQELSQELPETSGDPAISPIVPPVELAKLPNTRAALSLSLDRGPVVPAFDGASANTAALAASAQSKAAEAKSVIGAQTTGQPVLPQASGESDRALPANTPVDPQSPQSGANLTRATNQRLDPILSNLAGMTFPDAELAKAVSAKEDARQPKPSREPLDETGKAVPVGKALPAEGEKAVLQNAPLAEPSPALKQADFQGEALRRSPSATLASRQQSEQPIRVTGTGQIDASQRSLPVTKTLAVKPADAPIGDPEAGTDAANPKRLSALDNVQGDRSAALASRTDAVGAQQVLPARLKGANRDVAAKAPVSTNEPADEAGRTLPKHTLARAEIAPDLTEKESANGEIAGARALPSHLSPLASQPSNSAPQSTNFAAPIASNPLPTVANGTPAVPPADRSVNAQMDQAIEQLHETREASRTARSELTVRHAEFGAVNMRLEAAAGGDLRAILANRDPGFVPAIQAALADRAVSASSETATSSNNQSGSRHSENGSNGSTMNNQNGGNWGSGAGSDSRYGSFLGGEGSAPQPSLEQLEEERRNNLSRDEDAQSISASNGTRGSGLFA